MFQLSKKTLKNKKTRTKNQARLRLMYMTNTYLRQKKLLRTWTFFVE